MKKENFRKDWVSDFETFKKLVLERFGEEQFRNLQENINKLATFHYKKKKGFLLGKERELYNFLIENSYNPYRVYRWFLAEKLPEQIRFQLRQGIISQKTAFKISFKRRHESRNEACIDIKLQGLQLVRAM